MTAYHKLKGTNGQRTTTNGGAVSVFIVYPFIRSFITLLSEEGLTFFSTNNCPKVLGEKQ